MRHWPYILTGVVFAGVMGWISYTDALFVTRLAGNGGGIAYAYPTLPDGLLFFSLLALTEAARAGAARPKWATAGLILGAVMTLAANAGAGLAHSILDAIIDGLVPVCFFICVEIVLWHIRRGREAARPVPVAVPVTRKVPSVREVRERQNCGPETAKKILAEIRAYERSRGVNPNHAPAPAAQSAPAAYAPPVAAGALNGRSHGS